MSDKKDLFSRAIEIYRSKYKMNLEGLLKFIRDKIDSPGDTLTFIGEQILSHHEQNENITEEELRNYLHLVAAVQAKVDVRDKSLEEFKDYNKIKFKSRRTNVENKQDASKTQVEPKAESKTQPKVQTQEHSKVEPKAEPEKEHKKELQKEQPKPITKENTAKKEKYTPEFSQPTKCKTPPKQSKPLPCKATNPVLTHATSSTKQKSQQKLNLGTIEQNEAQEDRTSNFVRESNSEQFFAKFPEAQLMKMRTTSQKLVQIRGYDKFGQNYFNPIIKYRILYKDKSIYRRYTQFDNLMKYLNKRYEGFILPEIPPKEGIKSNLSYVWGLDQAFLNDRQQKLEEMLNVLMISRFISEDQVLVNFLIDQDYEVQSDQAAGTLNYLRSLGEIAFNAKQLKTYGMAYYNYFKSFKKTDINTKVTDCYKSAQAVLSYCLQLQSYRAAIISNFDKRREIFKELEVDQNDRTLTITQFDKLSSASAAQVRNLDKQMNKYYQLKSQQSWLGYLITQKESQLDNTIQQIKKQQKDIQSRINKMQSNLIDSIDSLVRSKTMLLEQIGSLMVEWRKCIHP